MDYAKILTVGVGSWLGFESACDRSGLFNEKYLTSPIGQILSARSGNRTLAEYRHPVLADRAIGPGRRPEIDFVVHDEHQMVVLAVEAKWVGRTKPSIASILWDLIRLELVAHHKGARCLFIVAGTRQRLESVFNDKSFSDADTKPQRKPLLRHDNNVLHRTPLVPTVPVRTPILKKLFTPFQDMEFPETVVTRRTAPFPPDPKPRHYQVYAWEVLSPVPRRTFRPHNSKHYVS